MRDANQVILDLDENSDTFDDYDRLLVWIWADGQLLNYILAQKGYADVKYLYDDYKYNDYLLDAEYAAQNQNLGIWGEDIPYYNPEENYSISEAQSPDESSAMTIREVRRLLEGTKVNITGIISAQIGYNAFIQDETGGIYIFTNNKKFYSLEKGNEITIQATLQDYNGLLELVAFKDNDILVLSEGNTLYPKTITLDLLSESVEGEYIKIQNSEINFIDYKPGEKGYSLFITQNGTIGEIRVDKYLESYPEPSLYKIGDIINVTGNIAQHYDSYQIMISSTDDIEIIN